MEFDLKTLTHSSNKYVFTRMQNIIWATRGLGLSYLLESDAGNLLGSIVEKVENEKSLVVNFTRITEIDDHALDGFFDSLIKSKRQVIIIDGNHLFNRIDQLRKGKGTVSIEATSDIIRLGNDKKIKPNEIESNRKKVVETFKKDAVISCIEKFPKRRLSSTPLVADGEYNSNRLISNIKQFMWLSSLLADELDKIISDEKIENPKLLSVSLRGAPFAASIGLLLSLPFETIDHFGPKHKVFDNDFLNRIEKGSNYIFVGDFCIGGTEIKTAKMYTNLKGSFLNHAIVIGNQIDPKYFKDYFKLYSLVDLNKLSLVKYSF